MLVNVRERKDKNMERTDEEIKGRKVGQEIRRYRRKERCRAKEKDTGEREGEGMD